MNNDMLILSHSQSITYVDVRNNALGGRSFITKLGGAGDKFGYPNPKAGEASLGVSEQFMLFHILLLQDGCTL